MSTSRLSEWRLPAMLVLLSLVPAIAGTARLAELAGGAKVTPANLRFFMMPLPVVLHILAVIPFSIIGAFQFSAGFRKRNRAWHRAAGKVIGVCGLVAALSGLWMTQFYAWPEGDGFALYVLRLVFGTAMAISIILGIDAVRRRDFVSHGAWMTRGYAIGMGAGTQVLTHLPWFIFFGKPHEFSRAVLMGAGWVINMGVAELIIRRRRGAVSTREGTRVFPQIERHVKPLLMPILSVLLVVLGLPDAGSAQSHLTRTNPAGPHAVGLRVVEQYDRSRGYRGVTDPFTGQATKGERARPIQTLIWYPAEKGTGSAVHAENYLRLGATHDDFGHASAERDGLEAGYVSSRVSTLTPERAKIELTASMLAKRDATPLVGNFPVVIYAPSYRAEAFENADLCEYLASHGYVVIASPSVGQTPGGMTDDLEGAETQVGDIEFLIGYAHGLPQADVHRLTVIGYSWGGLANVMAAAKDSRILALVSLDGSVRTYPAVIEQSRFLTPSRITAPLLYVAATPKQVEDLSSDVNAETSFLNRMKYADLYRVTLAPYVHANFSVMGQRFMADDAYRNYNKDELSAANGWLELYVRNFLDGYLKGDAAGRAFMDTPGDKIGAPPHLLTTYVAKAQGVPPTSSALAAELARQGFDRASIVYAAFKKRDSSFALSEVEVNAWGYKLMRAGDTKSSIAILRLNAELHADSWNAFDSLGEAYGQAGDKAMAVDCFRKSLAMNADNTNAVAWLKQLGARP